MSQAATIGFVATYSTIAWVFVGPYIAYWTLLFWRMRSHPIIKNRNPTLTMLGNSLALLMILVDRPLFSWIHLNHIDNAPIAEFEANLLVFSTYGFAYAYACKSWLAMYDTLWRKMTSEGKWKHLINDRWSDDSFWGKYHSTLGNGYFVTTRVYPLVWLLAFSVVLAITYGTEGSIKRRSSQHQSFLIANSVFYMVPIIVIALCFTYTPHWHDKFKVRDEMRLVCICSILGLMSYVVIAAFVHREASRLVYTVLFTLVGTSLFGAVSLISTFWVMQLSGVVKKADRNRGKSVFQADIFDLSSIDTGAESGVNGDDGTGDGNDNDDEEEGNFMPLQELLAHEIGLESFMAYLLKEFSSENLLCVIELKQFLEELKKEIFVNLGQTDPDVDRELAKVRFAEDSVPESLIVHMDSSFSQKATALCKKYIFSDSEHMVNVSGKVRKQLVRQCHRDEFASVSEEDLYSTFGAVLIQLQKLMNDSYHRFVSTKSYAVIEGKIHSRTGSMVMGLAGMDAAAALAGAPGNNPRRGSALR